MDEKEIEMSTNARKSKMQQTTERHADEGFQRWLDQQHEAYLEQRRQACPNLVLLHEVLKRGDVREFDAARRTMITHRTDGDDEMGSE